MNAPGSLRHQLANKLGRCIVSREKKKIKEEETIRVWYGTVRSRPAERYVSGLLFSRQRGGREKSLNQVKCSKWCSNIIIPSFCLTQSASKIAEETQFKWDFFSAHWRLAVWHPCSWAPSPCLINILRLNAVILQMFGRADMQRQSVCFFRVKRMRLIQLENNYWKCWAPQS